MSGDYALVYVSIRWDDSTRTYRIERSVDGAGWELLYVVERGRAEAESLARVYVAGMRDAGHTNVRLTSAGFPL